MPDDLILHGVDTSQSTLSNNPDIVVSYSRDKAYLDVPPAAWGDQRLSGLVAVFPTGTYLSFKASGKYTVNWGDGTSNNYATGATASKYYDYNSINSAPTSKGYKQVLVTITPQAATNLTSIDLSLRHASAVGASYYTTPWIDINLVGNKLTSFTLGKSAPSIYHRLLERISILDSAISNFSYMFDGCSALEEVANLATNSGTSFSYMFRDCFNLQKITSGMSVSTAGSITEMFANCYQLKDLGNIGLYAVNNLDSAFRMCVSLVNSPASIVTTTSGVSAISTFEKCVRLKKLNNLNLSGCTTTGALATMLADCHVLAESNMSNIRTNISFSGCNLSREAILNIFNNLYWITGKTIDISNNPGTAMLSTADRSIATTKGWTVVG